MKNTMKLMISERDKLRIEMNWSVTKSFLSLGFATKVLKVIFFLVPPMLI